MFLLKSHPGDGFGKTSLEFEGLQEFPNVNFVKNSISIHDVIASSDLWMSFNSSTNLEAWLMNKPSLRFKPTTSIFLKYN